jgi:single-stranded DNA-specific DHH superfamily exonuclease
MLAASRFGKIHLARELLLTQDTLLAMDLAQNLNKLNQERMDLQKKMEIRAREIYLENNFRQRLLVPASNPNAE